MTAHSENAHMRAALALARRGLGETWPNPSVGCVLARDTRVVGRGTTAAGGRPHAEVVALRTAGTAARGASAFVTLEPCCHHGRAGPCTEALIAAGVERVVMALRDPDPRVDGGGVMRLRAAGIAVEEGLLSAEARVVTSGFLCRVAQGRPEITLKLASTLDGRIATRTQESRWITSPLARRAAHALRGRSDAVMVGLGTVLADDPELTCRLAGFRDRPLVRIVLDRDLRIPLTTKLVLGAPAAPLWVLHASDVPKARAQALVEHNVRLFSIPASDAGIDLPAAFAALGEAGLTSVLVEGGAHLAASLLGVGLVDRLAWFHAPALLGADALAAVANLWIDRLDAMPRFVPCSVHPLGPDVLREFVREAA